MVHYLGGEMPLGYDSIHSSSFAWAHGMAKEYENVSQTPWKDVRFPHNHVAICDALSEAAAFVNMLRENKGLVKSSLVARDAAVAEAIHRVQWATRSFPTRSISVIGV